jgi:putative membrane protein
MQRLLLRLFVNAVALWAAATLIPGVTLDGQFSSVLLVALVFGVVNALVRPLALLLTFPVVLLTLGLFTFVINALMLWLTASLVGALSVAGFGAALLGSLVITVVSLLMSIFVSNGKRRG